MKRTVVLFVVFIGLVAAALYFKGRTTDETASFDTYEGSFAIPDINSVGRVILSHHNGLKIDLKKESGHWTVNDMYKARPASIKTLLDGIQKVEIKYIPANAAVKNILNQIKNHGIQVQIYNNDGSTLKEYYVGGSNANERGTNYLMEGSDQPFVTHLPGWDGGLRARFVLSMIDWRDRHFLDFKSDEIQKVSVEYPLQRSESFSIIRDKNSFSVQPYYDNMPRSAYPYRQGAGENFFQAFDKIGCESYEPQYPKKDSIRALVPFSKIRLRTVAGDSLMFTLHPRGKVSTSDFSPRYHRYFLDCSNGDFMLAQHSVMEKILRGYSYFFETSN